MATGAGERLKTAWKHGGARYSALFAVRALVDRMRNRLDHSLAKIERRKNIVGPWTIAGKRFTAAENRSLWNSHDWSKRGEEWTKSPGWKRGIIETFLMPNIPIGGVVAEVGPGGGRWTEVLQQRVQKLFLVDVSDEALAICRARFRHCSNIEYLRTDGSSLIVPDRSLDAVWSYDVFVHINPVDARGYFHEFGRALKAGARAVVHHPGQASAGDRDGAWRSDLTDAMVREFAKESGLRVLTQTREFVNEGDVLTILEKDA